jgi:hypothetical protein
MRLSKPIKSEQDILLAASSLTRQFCSTMASAAAGKPILDIACGSGRNAFALARLGCTVICADKDLSCLTAPEHLAGQIIPQQLDLVTEGWPFKPLSAGGIINVHFLLPSLFPHFESTLSKGACLLLETVPGCGRNYLQLPKEGHLRSLLKGSFDLEFYKERSVGPAGSRAVVVQLFAKKL